MGMGEALTTIVAGIAALFVMALLFRWLWNITALEVFGLKTITFWQSVRVLILAGILFGGTRVIDVAPYTLNGTMEQHEDG